MPTQVLTFSIQDSGGSDVANALIVARLNKTDYLALGGTVFPEVVVATTDENGAATIDLTPNSLGTQASLYYIQVYQPTTGMRLINELVTMPDAAADFSTLIASLPALPVNQAEAFAVAAAASAVDAAASAALATSVYDNFDDRYLGVKVSDPIVDNDGDPLVDGMFYFNSTNDEMVFYDGAAWQDFTTQAQTSATSAASSAASALADRNLAETAKTDAEAAEALAQIAKTDAETAKTNAETAQTAAELAETNAASSAALVESIYDSFDDRYLGAKSSAPTVDNDGNTLVAGTYYYNTITAVMGVWSGSAWQYDVTLAQAAATAAQSAQTAAETAKGLAETAQTNAETAQTAAELAETNAQTAESNATAQAVIATAQAVISTTQASSATSSASSATNSSSSAAGYAGAASDAQGYSEEWANAAEDTLISVAAGGDGSTEYSAKHWAAKAEAFVLSADTLGELNNVTLTTVTDSEVLQYDSTSSKWINQTLAEAGIASATTQTAILAKTNYLTVTQAVDLNALQALVAGMEPLATIDQTAGEIEAIVSHDNLQSIPVNDHIDWTADYVTSDIHVNNISETSVTQHQAALSVSYTQMTGDIAWNDFNPAAVYAIDYIVGGTANSKTKWRIGGTSSYSLGSDDTLTFGGLNAHAFAPNLTFMCGSGLSNDIGFWWGHLSHSASQGAMSLTNIGELAVATSLKLGYGQSDTSVASSPLDVFGNISVSGLVDGRDVADDGITLDTIDAPNILYTDTAQTISGVKTFTGAPILNADAKFEAGYRLQGVDSSAATQDLIRVTTKTLVANGNLDTNITGANNIEHSLGGINKLNVSVSGIEVTGAIAVTGLVDGRDIATDGTTLDGLIIGSTVEAYDATILKDADIGVSVQGYNANTSLTNAAETFSGAKTLTGDLLLQNVYSGGGKIIGGDGTTNPTYINIDADSVSGSKIEWFLDSTRYFYAQAGAATKIVFNFNLESTSSDINLTNGDLNLTNGNITVGGTVDGRDVATDGTTLDGLASSALDWTADQTTNNIHENNFQDINVPGFFNLGSPSLLTIASGVITAISSRHTVDTQSAAASDDLDTINGGVDGHVLQIAPESETHTVVVRSGTGNILLTGGSFFSMSTLRQNVMLMYDSTQSAWREIGRCG